MKTQHAALRIAIPVAIVLASTLFGSALAGQSARGTRPATIVHRYRLTTRPMYYTFASTQANPFGR